MKNSKKNISAQSPFFIDLPQKSDDVFLVIEFPYGFMYETNARYSIGHLCEHYVGALLLKNNIEVFGSIGPHDMRYEWKVARKRSLKELVQVASFFTSKLPEDTDLFESEKSRLSLEMSERQYDPSFHSRELMVTSLIKEPKYLRRYRWDQINTVMHISFKDIEKFHAALVRSFPPSVAVGAHGLSAKEKHEIDNGLRNLGFPSGIAPLSVPPAIFTSRKTVQVYSALIAKGTTRFMFMFPAYAHTHDLSDRIIVNFLTRTITRRFEIAVKGSGIYTTDDEYFVSANYGFTRFFLLAPTVKGRELRATLLRVITEINNDHNLERDLRAYIRGRKQMTQTVARNNADTMDWMSSDLSSTARFTGPDQVLHALGKINMSRVRHVLGEIFTASALRTFLYSSREE